MKLSKAEIRREIEKISSSYSTDDIFSSPYLKDILQAIVTSACEPLTRVPDVKAFCNPASDFTACTEGLTVCINTLGPLIRECGTNWDRYVNCVGHVIHECGHVLFTDFVEMTKLTDAWFEKEFSFYPEKPEIEGIDAERVADYLNRHPNYRKIFLSEMKNIQNVMEDVYIENQLFDHFDGVAALGLAGSRKELYRLSLTDSEICGMVLSGRISPLTAFVQLLLSRRSGYPLKEAEHLTDDQKTVKELLEGCFDLCEEEIDRLKWEENGKIRDRMLNRVLVKVKPLLPEIPDSTDMPDPGEGQQPCGGSSDYSDDAAEQQISMSERLCESTGASRMPQGSSRPVASVTLNRDRSASSEKKAKQMSESDAAVQHRFEQALKDIATKDFRVKDEKKHREELQKEADGISAACEQARGSGACFAGYRIERPEADNASREIYDQIYSEVSVTSKHLARKLKNLLDVREMESLDSGYLMGQRFNARDVIRGDGRYFSRIASSGDRIRVCFGVLVDESGSMYGKKVEEARRATILLEDTLRTVGVPFMICGHTTSWEDNRVRINSYVDFDTNDGQDRFRLSGISGNGGNIDGAAITYVGEKLLKRPEEQKVMIVISDGEPAGISFYSTSEDEDTSMAAAHYRRKGISVFGAVIDDFDEVMRLYGEQNCFDCRKDGELERQLVRLMRRYVRYY